MRTRFGVFFLSFLTFFPVISWAQRPPNIMTTFETGSMRVWVIAGVVTGMDGQPVSGASVKVSAAAGTGPARLMDTDLQGKFRTEYELDPKLYTRLNVQVSVSKPGFIDAMDSGEFAMKEGTREFLLVLRQAVAGDDQLALSSLIQYLASGLRAAPGSGSVPSSVGKTYLQGIEKFLSEERDTAQALKKLRQTVEAEPSCTPCRVAASLVQLDMGSWVLARNNLLEAAGFGSTKVTGAQSADALLALGTMAAWSQQTDEALSYYASALEKRPGDSLALQEMGRALIAKRNWEQADQYLDQAVQAGASAEARAMRIQVLLELGDTPEAESQMDALLNGRELRTMPASTRLLHARLAERLQLQSYASVKSVVDQPLKDLIKGMPELLGIEPAPDQGALPDVLERIGASVDSFIHSLPNTSSREAIREEILDRQGKVRDTNEEKYLYLMLIEAEELPEGTKELRTRDESLTPDAASLKKGFMITSGFVSSPLNFHASQQSRSKFRLLGRQTLDGRPTFVLAFAQRPETAKRVGRFLVDGKSLPVLVQGIAWVDVERNQILRLRTDLLKSPPKSRLQRQTTEIVFGEVKFDELATSLWLPQEVTVTVEWKGRVFRNNHRYSDFRVFNVDAIEKRVPKIS